MNIITNSIQLVAQSAGRSVLDRDLISEWHQDYEHDVVVFNYDTDFEFMWGLRDGQGGLHGIAESLRRAEPQGKSRHLQLIVTYSGSPSPTGSQVAVSNYVTAFDWAAALTLALYSVDPSNTRPRICFHILSLNNDVRGFLGENLFAFQNVLPWIQGYYLCRDNVEWVAEAVFDDQDSDAFACLRQVTPASRQDAKVLVRDIMEARRTTCTFPDDSQPDRYFPALRASWRQSLLGAGTRHSVGNLIGPFLLAEGFAEEDTRAQLRSLLHEESSHRRALVEVLIQLELIDLADHRANAVSTSIRLEKNGGPFDRRTNVRFLLIDDQYQNGFHHIVASCVFGNDYASSRAKHDGGLWRYSAKGVASLVCANTPRSIFDALGDRAIEDWSEPREFKHPDCDVLLLDLRLWLDEEFQRRRDYCRDLLLVCRKINAAAIEDSRLLLAIEALEYAVENDKEYDFAVLAVLPLLLSHFDPSLPIIIFSSTQQRRISSLLAHRNNIVLTFSKPILTDYSEQLDAAIFVNSLTDALNEGLHLHEARVLWERIGKISWREPWPRFRSGGNSYNGPTQQAKGPRLLGKVLRKHLAQCYQYYVQGAAYYDFSTIPYELIESNFSSYETNSSMNSSAFSLANVYRNQAGIALRDLRNYKAHGQLKRPETVQDKAQWRAICLLQFHFFLDFISAERVLDKRNGENLAQQLENSWQRIVQTNPKVDLSQFSKPPRPAELVLALKISWIEFALYTSLFAMRESHNQRSGSVNFSDASILAVQRLFESSAD